VLGLRPPRRGGPGAMRTEAEAAHAPWAGGAWGAAPTPPKRERGAHLGIQKLAITVTGSPRARGGRERWKKGRGRGTYCAGKSNEREIERGAHMGGLGATATRRRAGPGRAELGRVGLAGSRARTEAHNTSDH
jgi:hypothetical protein